MKAILSFAALAMLVVNSDIPNTGTLTGTVTNAESGELLPMSRVSLYPPGSGKPSKQILAHKGSFAQHGIPAGCYSASVVYEGFGSIIARDVMIKPDTVTDLNFLLKSFRVWGDSSDLVRPGKAGEDYTIHYLKPGTSK